MNRASKEFQTDMEVQFARKNAQERAGIIVDQYFSLSESRQSQGKSRPSLRLRKMLRRWLYDDAQSPDRDAVVLHALVKASRQSGAPVVEAGEKSSYSLDEVSAMYGVDPWTIRMWINRFGILTSRLDHQGDVLLTPQDTARIGMVARLARVKGLSVDDVRRHLETDEQVER